MVRVSYTQTIAIKPFLRLKPHLLAYKQKWQRIKVVIPPACFLVAFKLDVPLIYSYLLTGSVLSDLKLRCPSLPKKPREPDTMKYDQSNVSGYGRNRTITPPTPDLFRTPSALNGTNLSIHQGEKRLYCHSCSVFIDPSSAISHISGRERDISKLHLTRVRLTDQKRRALEQYFKSQEVQNLTPIEDWIPLSSHFENRPNFAARVYKPVPGVAVIDGQMCRECGKCFGSKARGHKHSQGFDHIRVQTLYLKDRKYFAVDERHWEVNNNLGPEDRSIMDLLNQELATSAAQYQPADDQGSDSTAIYPILHKIGMVSFLKAYSVPQRKQGNLRTQPPKPKDPLITLRSHVKSYIKDVFDQADSGETVYSGIRMSLRRDPL